MAASAKTEATKPDRMKMDRKKIERMKVQTGVTDPGPLAGEYECLPRDIPGLVKVVQGLFVHIFWAERYGVTPTEEQKTHVQARLVSRILEKVKKLDPLPLTVARPLEKCFFGNCRDFTVLMCSMLRYQGVPARARCGFGTYFMPNHFEDHWVCEYWDGERWVTVDAQLDALQRERMGITFNTLDMPAGEFVDASDAWLRCREGGEDPDKFGIFDMHGLWFIRGNLLRELAALNEAEMLPWDVWGFMEVQDADMTPEQWNLLDSVARALVAGDQAEIERLYREGPGLKVPPSMVVAGI